MFAPRNPIIKLPPQILEHEVNELYKMGFRRFHSCNTLKTDKGARSGKILQEFVSNQIMHLKSLDANNFCIAGGGIEHPQDIHYYQTIGADGYSFGSVCFNLFKLNKLIQYVS